MAGGRAFRPSAPRRAAFAALLTLLLLAFLSFLLSSGPALSRSSSSSPPSARLAAVRRHAADHAAVLAAYAAHARKLKEASAAQSLSFSTLSSDLSALSARLASHLSLPEDALKPLEKEARERIKLARALAADAKEGFDTQSKIQKLSDTVFAVGEQLARARRGGRMSSRIAAGSTPKSLHCLAMRLLEARLANPNPNAFADDPDPSPEFDDPSLYHYAVFSDNVLAVSVVVASAARAAADPSRHVFHVVTAPMYLPAFRVWFARRPPPLGVHVQLLAYSDFPFLNATNSPVIRQIEEGKSDVALLDYLRFYLPDMFPVLRRVVLLEDDVVVQKDLAALWQSDLDGKVNGAVEMCFGGFRRYRKYLNFTQPIVRDRFNPSACAWAYGVNVFDLQAWRRDGCTELFHQYMEMNEDGELWDPTSVLTAGLMTFYGNTKSLDKSWHVMGLGYNPSIGPEAIRSAAVIHFDGNMKPWLDVALNQYKALWTKYVDTEMEFLTLCNFGL